MATETAGTDVWSGKAWVLVGLGLLSLLMIEADTGSAGLAVGLALATLPVPVYVVLALWLDRFEAEPRQMLFAAFLWGAAGAVFFALVFNTTFEAVVAGWVGERAGETAGAVLSAPVVEELTKGVVLFLFFFRNQDEFDNVTDGIVYAAMVGLGFAMTENVQYYGNALREGVQGEVSTFILRGMLSPFAHPLFTSMTGIGLGVAREAGRRGLRLSAPLGGLALAVLLHAVWNASATADAFFQVYILVMVPVFVGVIVLVARSLGREARVLRAHLAPCVATGLLSPAEVERVCSTRGRMRARAEALRRGDVRAWRRRGELHQAVSELAFHRWRVERGITRGAELDAAREEELLARVGALCEPAA